MMRGDGHNCSILSIFWYTYVYTVYALLLESCCPVYYVVLYYYINSSCSFLTSLGSCPYTYAHPPSLLLYSPSFVERGEREKKIKFQQKKKWSFSMRCEPFLSIVVVDTIYDDFCAGSGMSRISEKAVHVPVRLHRSTNRHHLLNPSSFLSPALDVRI